MNNLINKIIFGCCKISKSSLKNKSVNLLNYAYELGIKNFDTAPLYSKGYSEILIGEVFKNKNAIFVTTKVGQYYTPNMFIPSSIAIPLNAILKNRSKKTRDRSNIDNDKNICENHFKTEILKSCKRLKNNNIDSFLIHELNPYKIEPIVLNNISCFLSKIGINKFGYGGALHNEFFEIKIPYLLDIVQIPFPSYFDDNYEKVKQLISKNNHVEFRFFNIFNEKYDISERMNQAKNLLLNFSNTKIIFQTSSPKRLKENIDFFTS